jgi:cytochrome c-type biogenesis protein CcmE
VQDDIDVTDDAVLFSIEFNDASARVVHQGSPPELFDPGQPVVLEGHWAATGDDFLADEIIVKHDEQYEADNGDRIADAEDGQTGSSTTP